MVNRFQLLNKCMKMGHNILIPECITVTRYNELKNNFEIINKNTHLNFG